nr:probable receptor-like protein kinase At1g80640 isoform X1 [Ipomoea trifida]
MASQGHNMEPRKKLIIALIAASTVLGLIIFLIFCLWIYHRKKAHKPHKDSVHSSDVVKGLALSQYIRKYNSMKSNSWKLGCVSLMDYKALELGTNNFEESNVLGKGGFGCVYKGKLGENLYVAVKKLEGITQDAIKEFETEVELLSKMQHPNIISLLGYSIRDDTRIIVYELMQNGSLESHLHDASFNAKLSDFGLAIPDGAQNKNNIKLSGTLGYVAPEYLLDGKLTDKSDVYGFGVVLLELLLGRRPVEKLAPSQCQSLVTWVRFIQIRSLLISLNLLNALVFMAEMQAMPQLTDRSKLPSIVDPVIKNTMDLKHLHQVAAVAVLCVQPEPSYRPLITDVLHSLIPLVPIEMGGTLRITQRASSGSEVELTLLFYICSVSASSSTSWRCGFSSALFHSHGGAASPPPYFTDLSLVFVDK